LKAAINFNILRRAATSRRLRPFYESRELQINCIAPHSKTVKKLSNIEYLDLVNNSLGDEPYEGMQSLIAKLRNIPWMTTLPVHAECNLIAHHTTRNSSKPYTLWVYQSTLVVAVGGGWTIAAILAKQSSALMARIRRSTQTGHYLLN